MIAKEKYSEIVDEILQHDFIGKIAIDATVGRGNDTLKLLQAVGEEGFVYGYDIQQEAISSTENRLGNYCNYHLFLKSHESFEEVEQADIILYNLGYLPHSDKKIYTKADTTVSSLASAVNILNKGGIIIVVSYVGHAESTEERNAVEEFLSSLNQKEFIVERRAFLNQIHTPPVVYVVERKI